MNKSDKWDKESNNQFILDENNLSVELFINDNNNFDPEVAQKDQKEIDEISLDSFQLIQKEDDRLNNFDQDEEEKRFI
jgi:hypothetical protein